MLTQDRVMTKTKRSLITNYIGFVGCMVSCLQQPYYSILKGTLTIWFSLAKIVCSTITHLSEYCYSYTFLLMKSMHVSEQNWLKVINLKALSLSNVNSPSYAQQCDNHTNKVLFHHKHEECSEETNHTRVNKQTDNMILPRLLALLRL